jgi:hypothetical protein
MEPRDEYLRNARECRKLAREATSPESKADWLRMAAHWESRASEAEDDIFHRPIETNGNRPSP